MKWITAVLMALVGTGLFPQLICDDTLTASNTVLCLGVFGALLWLFLRNWRRLNWRWLVFSHLAGALFSVMTAFGFSVQNTGAVAYSDPKLWLAIVFFTHVYGVALSLLWELLERAEPVLAAQKYGAKLAALDRGLDWVLRKPWLVGLILLGCWMPCYLSTYPGNFVYDATKEFQQLETGYLGDFPMLHSVLITRLLAWSIDATGAYEAGIAVFTLGQMLLIAAMFSHMLWKLRRLGTNRFLLVLLTLYWAGFPTIHLLVTSTVRDVLFSALLTYSMFVLWLMCRDIRGFMGSWWKCLGPAVVLVLTVFSRNNNSGLVMPIALGAVSLLLFLVGGRKGWKGALSFAAAALGSFLILNGVLTAQCQPMTEASPNASMTVYTQSLVRAYMEEGESWSAKEKLAMMGYFDMSSLRYVAENGDATKGRLRLETEEEKEAFLEFWRMMGRRYPAHYADAILANTRAMWFPGTVMDGYQESGVGLYAPYEKCYFYFADEIEAPGQLKGWLPQVHDWYQSIALQISYEKVPVVSLLFSVGFHFWLLLVCAFYAMERKARQLYLPLAVLLGYTLISAFVPLMLLRYFAALFLAFPLVSVFLLQPSVGHERK